MTNGNPQGQGLSQDPGKKKGLPALAWVGIGCGAIVIIGLIVIAVLGVFVTKKVKDVAQDFEKNPAKAAAELIVKMNPDLDLVETDDAAGTITIRNKETDEVATFDFEEIKQGRLSFQTDEGEVTFDVSSSEEGGGTLSITGDQGQAQFGAGAESIPDWVPIYPGVTPTSTFSTSTSESAGGIAGFTTTDGVAEVLDHYEAVLKDQGFEVGRQTFSGGGDFTQGTVTGTRKDPNRTVNAVAIHQDGETQVQLHYNEKK